MFTSIGSSQGGSPVDDLEWLLECDVVVFESEFLDSGVEDCMEPD